MSTFVTNTDTVLHKAEPKIDLEHQKISTVLEEQKVED